jgi:hypothetical protein
MPKRHRGTQFVIPFFALLITSCIGIDAGVEFRTDGSGSVSLEYRISRMVESMGKLDGNEALLPLPVGRTDFERTVARVRGLSLTSFTSKETATDIVISAGLSFSEPAALVTFLDATGRSAAFESEGSSRKLTLRLAEGGGPLDADLERLVFTVFKGYDVKLRVKTPTVPSSSAPGSVVESSRTASYQAAIADILSSKEPISWEISWKE